MTPDMEEVVERVEAVVSHGEWSQLPSADLRALLSELRKMVEALEDMRDAWLKRFGCFPGARYSPETRLYSRAMSRTYEIVGQGTEAERKAKLEALAQEIEAERVERRGHTFNFAAALTGSREHG